MRARTGVEIEMERDRLEREAAAILGYMLFEYSRLDMELGLLLVWSGDGRKCEFLTKKLGGYSIYRRLQCLGDLVEMRYADIPEAFELYSSWLADAHNTRVLRNQLIHGRWGIEPTKRKVVNVMGLPTSQEQKSTPFSLEELQCALESIKELRTRLHELRKLWPV